ncbi:AprI/Inh family metalloprotease inhibitor [Bosea rubneri]|uniref:AprI/Inh family metalloprotease inhibitor n=1 Tax=Bosea rubneri TaxID=3075434 RepID=A0ABU3S8M9_9HYPH|nr:AprI/Inh family metalloprotease inhibitor [Bosea sp. ZW T0_25]MDU0341150.1 AprI/Inh family metalloprotease inhibitor [Bosea sp. ZW T0_25]
MRCTGTLRVERSLLEKTLLPDLPCLPRALPKAASARLARRLAAVAVLGSAFAVAPAPTLAQWERGASYAGVWSVRFTDSFGHRQSCSIELSAAGSIMGAYRANPRGCGSALVSVSRWQPRRSGISLDDVSGRPLIALRAGWDGLSGTDEAGRPIRLAAASAQRGNALGPSFDERASPSSRCSVYYGRSERCAEARDVAAPRLAPGQSTTVRIVYPANLRQFPSLGAQSLALIPMNTCVTADSCTRQEDGAEWCRMNYAGRTGYVVKLFARDGRRRILYSNQCGP